MQAKFFWYFLMTGAIVLWVASIIAGHLLFPDNELLAWSLFAALVAIHASEIKKCLALCGPYGLSKRFVVVKTLLFGFTWWVPLKRGIIER
jgi:hypothetical protein